MKTSVIIPVYNVEKYLKTCVDTVLSLKSEIEVLLINDGSTDQSGKICDALALKDNRIRVIHKENGGLSSARNVGIKNSTGDYLLFLDSDDFLNVEEADRLLLNTTGEADAILGLYREFYEDQNLYKDEDCSPFLQNKGLINIDDFLKIIPRDGESCYLTAWRFVVKREYLLENNLYFFNGIYHEDEEWVPRMLFGCDKIIVSDCFFYCYRQARFGSIMGTVKPKHIWDTFTIIEHYREMLETGNLKPIAAEFLHCRLAICYITNIINCRILNKNQCKTAIQKLKLYYPYCKNYFYGLKGRLIAVSLKILGTNITTTLLKIAFKLYALLH